MSLAQILAFLATHPNFASNHPGLMAHVDLDSDGYSGATDCDDRDPTTHPGAVDAPFDGLDQDCDGINACEFQVTDWNGDMVWMPNEIVMSPSGPSPIGLQTIDPNGQEVLRFNLRVVHPECPDVTWESGSIIHTWSDRAGTNWSPSNIQLFNLTVDGTTQTIWNGELEIGQMHMEAHVTGDLLPAGSTTTFSVWNNLTGASAARDDFMFTEIHGDSMVWCSMNACSDINAVLLGNTISF